MRYFKYLLLLMLISCNLNKHEISEMSCTFNINDFFKRSEYEVDTFIYDEKLLSFKINNFNTITLFKNSFDGSMPPNQEYLGKNNFYFIGDKTNINGYQMNIFTQAESPEYIYN